MGEGESLPLLVGEKFLPLIPSGSGGYAAATVWNWHRESGEGHLLTAGPDWPTVRGQEAASPRTALPPAATENWEELQYHEGRGTSLRPVHPRTHGAGRDGSARGRGRSGEKQDKNHRYLWCAGGYVKEHRHTHGTENSLEVFIPNVSLLVYSGLQSSPPNPRRGGRHRRGGLRVPGSNPSTCNISAAPPWKMLRGSHHGAPHPPRPTSFLLPSWGVCVPLATAVHLQPPARSHLTPLCSQGAEAQRSLRWPCHALWGGPCTQALPTTPPALLGGTPSVRQEGLWGVNRTAIGKCAGPAVRWRCVPPWRPPETGKAPGSRPVLHPGSFPIHTWGRLAAPHHRCHTARG